MFHFKQSSHKIQYGVRRSAVYIGYPYIEVKSTLKKHLIYRNYENSIKEYVPRLKILMPRQCIL